MLNSINAALQNIPSQLLTCPLCELSLERKSNSLICENNHCFDYAKEGYINLLPPQHKKTKDPGDNKTMILSRRDFLDTGYYDFLSPAIINTIREISPEEINPQQYFLDVGAGEGYFTHHIYEHLKKEFTFYGMDISKEAVRLAAKRNKNIHWFVASSNNIPIQNKSLNIVLKINAPLNFQSIKNKLCNKAIVISVSPGKNHLAKLRETMYLKPQTHKQEQTPEGFVLLQQTTVEKTIAIPDQKDINRLFIMTPYYWNASSIAKTKVGELKSLETTASFNINVYQAI